MTGSAVPRFVASCAAIFVVAIPADAGPAFDLLRHRLSSFRDTTAVAGKIEIVREETSEKTPKVKRGSAEFECDAATLRLSATTQELSRITTATSGVNEAMVTLPDAWHLVSAAPQLLRELTRAASVVEQPSTWNGQKVTRVEMTLRPEPVTDAPKGLKVSVEEKKVIWVASDGTPLASENTGKVTARFLIISMTGNGKSTVEYTVAGDRLLVVHSVDDSASSGMGTKGQQKTTTTVTLRP